MATLRDTNENWERPPLKAGNWDAIATGFRRDTSNVDATDVNWSSDRASRCALSPARMSRKLI